MTSPVRASKLKRCSDSLFSQVTMENLLGTPTTLQNSASTQVTVQQGIDVVIVDSSPVAMTNNQTTSTFTLLPHQGQALTYEGAFTPG